MKINLPTKKDIFDNIVPLGALYNINFPENATYLYNERLNWFSHDPRGISELITEELYYSLNYNKMTYIIYLFLQPDTKFNSPKQGLKYIRANKAVDFPINLEDYVVKIVPTNYVNNERLYVTTDDLFLVDNSCGCYMIKNDTLGRIYIGETIRTFHIRWTEHKGVIGDNKYCELVSHPDTIFSILESTPKDKVLTERLEKYYLDLMKRTTKYEILGGTFYENLGSSNQNIIYLEDN